ncbi:MAG: hypothetical protein AAB444_01230 [Patescibacteria group bacterium]
MAESAYAQCRQAKQEKVIHRLALWGKKDGCLGAELQEMAKAMKTSAGQTWVFAAEIVLDLIQGMDNAGGLPRIKATHRGQVAQDLPWSKDMQSPPQATYDQEMTYLRNVARYEGLLTSVTVDLGVKLCNHPPADRAARFWIARIVRLIRIARRN